jgi:pimeloyl-ACP methyl ester carboxylesterase
MKAIYCISGLGADEKAFSRLKIDGYKLVYLPWLLPHKNESIAEYAIRMSAGITEKNPVLMGLSFGGMMSIEISKVIAAEKVILISSIKSSGELPWWMITAGRLRLNKIVSMKSYRILEPVQNRFLGVKNKDEISMVRNYRKNAPEVYTNWAINEVLNWRNTWQPPVLVHIHGDKDKMFPLKNVSPTHVIKGGGHFMIMNKAAEVSELINAAI